MPDFIQHEHLEVLGVLDNSGLHPQVHGSKRRPGVPGDAWRLPLPPTHHPV